ncbi:MAG: sigma-70 family RNA polymerase sigma factor [Mycolicibacterium sp.]|uniref:RNA polymerase sigma factor n=1 Tax=Mycolicibacterium sp. TaxID=2320850 RepID=UPI003D150481
MGTQRIGWRLGRDAMTVTAAPDWDIDSDAELAGAAANGDRVALAGIYDRYANRLHDFCLSMVRDPDTAADCVQDTFYTAATRLSTLRDPSKLRPWLYAIARNEALRHLRARRREQPCAELPDTASHEPEPDILATRAELSALVDQAAGGLSDRDRMVLELTYRHGLDGPELAEVLGVSAQSARTLAHRLRETVERSLGALLVARQARSVRGCPELDTLLADWDGQFTILMRKRIARHIDSCSECEERRRGLVNPVAMLGGAPLFIPAPEWLRESTLSDVQLTCAATAIAEPTSPVQATTGADVPDGGAGARPGRGSPRPVLVVVAAAVSAVGLALVWPSAEPAPLSPAGVTDPAGPSRPAPAAQLPGSTLPTPPGAGADIPTGSPPASLQPPNVAPVVPVVPAGADAIPQNNLVPAPPPIPGPPIDEGDATSPAEVAPPDVVPAESTDPWAPPRSDSSGSSESIEDSSGSSGRPSESSGDSAGSPGSPDSADSTDSSDSAGSPGSSGGASESTTAPDPPTKPSESTYSTDPPKGPARSTGTTGQPGSLVRG